MKDRFGSVEVRSVSDDIAKDKVRETRTYTIYHILMQIDKVVGNPTTYSEFNSVENLDVVRVLRTSLGKNYFRVFQYFLEKGAATGRILFNRLKIEKSTAYDIINFFASIGLIEPKIKLGPRKGMKKGATIWGILDCTSEQVRATHQDHLRSLSIKYSIAADLAQTLLEDYAKRSITEVKYSEIVIHIKTTKIKYNTLDLADMVTSTLLEEGIKVWR